MQTNMWSRITLLCGNHEDGCHPEMMPHAPAEGSISRGLYGAQTNMFYSCPRYYPENRDPGEPCCRNHISIKEFEGIITHLDRATDKIESLGGTVDLTGERWRSKSGVEYKVVKQTKDTLYVECLNRRVVWKK